MKNKRGFTLIEMVVTIALILILTTVFTSSMVSYIYKSQSVSTKADSHMNNYKAAKDSVDALGKQVIVTLAPVTTYTVTFIVKDDTGATQILPTPGIVSGGSAVPPATPGYSGMVFDYWDGGTYTNITSNQEVTAMYKPAPAAVTYTVTFIYKNSTGGEVIYPVPDIPSGGSAAPPATTGYPGNAFDHWEGTYTNVISTHSVTAIYKSTALTPTLILYSSYGTGPYTGQYGLTIQNVTTTNMSTWEVTITVPAGSTVTGSNGNYSISGTTLTITPVSYNNNISAGSSTNMGFELNTPGPYTAPTPTVTGS